MNKLILLSLIICLAVAQLHTRQYDLDGKEILNEPILAQWAKEYYPEESDLEINVVDQQEQQLAVVTVSSADGDALEPTLEEGETLVNKQTTEVVIESKDDSQWQFDSGELVALTPEEQQELFYQQMQAEKDNSNTKDDSFEKAQQDFKLTGVENGEALTDGQAKEVQAEEVQAKSDVPAKEEIPAKEQVEAEEQVQAKEEVKPSVDDKKSVEQKEEDTKSLNKADDQKQQNIQVTDNDSQAQEVQNSEPAADIKVDEPLVAESGKLEIVSEDTQAVEQVDQDIEQDQKVATESSEVKVEEPLIAESGELEIIDSKIPEAVQETVQQKEVQATSDDSKTVVDTEAAKESKVESKNDVAVNAESTELKDTKDAETHNDVAVNSESTELKDAKVEDQTLKNTDVQQTLVQGKCIIVYSQCQYKGDSMEVCHSLKDIEAFNHDIQSIYIPKGLGLTVFDGENFEGNKHKYTESQACLNEPISFAQIQTAPKMSYNLRAKL